MTGGVRHENDPLDRAMRVALDRERRAARRAWTWETVTLMVGMVVAVAAPVLVGVAVLVVGLVAFPAAMRSATVRRLDRAADWSRAAVSIVVEGVGKGRRARAVVRVADRPPFTTNVRRSTGTFPPLGSEVDGYVSLREELLLTPDGRVYRLPRR